MTPEGAPAGLRYDSPEATDPPPGTAWAAILARVPAGAAVLDVGCSTGRFALAMKARGCSVTGVEVNPEAARIARSRCDAVLVGDVAGLLAAGKLPDAAFDVIVAADVLEHLVDPWTVVRGFRRLLREGGIVLASLPNVTHASVVLELARGRFPTSPEGLLDETHLRFFGEQSALALFTGAGFRAELVDRTRMDPRLTEFHTPLEPVPDAVLDFLDRNPNADTYQFIIRAAPAAGEAVAALEEAPPPEAPLRNRLVGEVNEVRAELRRYHESTELREREMRDLHARLAEQHEAAVARVHELSELHARLGEYHHALSDSRTELAETRVRLRSLLSSTDQARIELMQLRSRSRRRQAIVGSLVRTFVPWSALRVLYVADRNEAPFRYRCLHGAAQLRRDGVAADVMHVTDADLLDVLPGYSVVILFRLPWTSRVEAIVQRVRAQGATLVFESDDLIFDPDVTPLVPFLQDCPEGLRHEYLERFALTHETFKACDLFLGGTPALVRRAAELGQDGLLHPNLLSPTYERYARLLVPARRFLAGPPTIAYLSGSNTHDRDLASIAGALAAVLARNPSVQLLLCGFVSIPSELAGAGGQLRRLAYQDWRAYPWALVRARVSLAPAGAVNEFTNAKSALKFFEAGVFGVPTVATPTETFREAITDGVDGFLAETPAEWVEKIELALDPARNRAVGVRARRTALAQFSFAAHRGRLRDLLLPIVGRAPGRMPRTRPLAAGERGPERLRDRVMRVRRQIALLRGRVPVEDTSLPAWCTPIEAARFDALLAAGDAPIRDGVVRPLAGWQAHSEIEAAGDKTWRVTGNDPVLLSPPVDVDGPAFRYLVVRMRAVADTAPASAQLFWAGEGAAGFTEGQSVCWSVQVDGMSRTYVMDLAETRWRQAGRIHALRLDPLGSPGRVTLDAVALVRDEPELAVPPDLGRALARRYLRGRGIECGGEDVRFATASDGRVTYVGVGTEARPDAAAPSGDVVAEARRLPFRDDSLDFCVGNHLLGCAHDPLATAGELLRVVRPGGVLLLVLAALGAGSQGHAPASMAHVLDDHDAGADDPALVRAHYLDAAARLHPDASPEEREALAAAMAARRAPVGFHVFEEPACRAFLEHAGARWGGRLEVLERRSAPTGDEFVAVLRRSFHDWDGPAAKEDRDGG